jgi:hypothetical protein
LDVGKVMTIKWSWKLVAFCGKIMSNVWYTTSID